MRKKMKQTIEIEVPDDFKDLKLEDKPVEVFINLED